MVQAPYVNLMAEALIAVREGRQKRLIFNLPPGHMKSLIISMLFSAWLLGVEPSKRILCISYGDDLTRQLSRLTRRLMTSRLYRRIFPGHGAHQAGRGPADHGEGRAAPCDRGGRSGRGLPRRAHDHRRSDAA
jgi:hypothetical protein